MKLSSFLKTNNLRTDKLRRNIVLSTILQGASMLLSLVLLPVSLEFVSIEQYGIWLTISSILMWFSYFDLGLGSGLKNKLAEALAKNDYLLARKYVSTAYAVIILIMGGLAIVYFLISDKVNWVGIFNLNSSYKELIQLTINVVIYFFISRFILQLINVILDSMQLIYLAKLNNTISQLLILVFILVYSKYQVGNILILGIIFSISPVIVFTISSFFVFFKYNYLRPSITFVDFGFAKILYSLGLKFFLIQLSMLVLFQTSNILIINFFGPEQVVQYNVAFNLFSMMTVAFSTVAAPYWAAYTNAWTQGDIPWIKKANSQLIKIWFLIVFVSLFVLIFSNQIYLLWLGKDLKIPFNLSFAIYIYMCAFSFSSIYNMFINGTGKILLQTISLGVISMLYIPILLLFVKVFNWGLISFPIALLLVACYSVFIAPMQYRALIAGTAKGIMNR
jgi:O-antigen/teichoic acid export membrane protein